MKHKMKRKTLNIIVFALAFLLVASCVTIAVIVSNNNAVHAISNNIGNSLSDAQNELSSVKDELAVKESEAESYSQAVDEQNSAFASEKDELNKQIDNLNKQIAKKQQQNQTQPQPIPQPVPAEPAPSVDGSAKTIYLTFDDGPSPNTPAILQILNDYGVKATFFVKNTAYNNYMNDIVNNGNAIALHTFSHEYNEIYSSDVAYYNDLQAISDVVFNQTGIRSNIMRFPGGSSNSVSKKYCVGIMSRVTVGVEERGYHYFDWNVTSGDANANTVPAETIVSNCRKLPKSNTVIVLMHDTAAKRTTVEALPQVIEYYKGIGCSFSVIDSSTPVVHHSISN